jgi:hypothetical protein
MTREQRPGFSFSPRPIRAGREAPTLKAVKEIVKKAYGYLDAGSCE